MHQTLRQCWASGNRGRSSATHPSLVPGRSGYSMGWLTAQLPPYLLLAESPSSVARSAVQALNRAVVEWELGQSAGWYVQSSWFFLALSWRDLVACLLSVAAAPSLPQVFQDYLCRGSLSSNIFHFVLTLISICGSFAGKQYCVFVLLSSLATLSGGWRGILGWTSSSLGVIPGRWQQFKRWKACWRLRHLPVGEQHKRQPLVPVFSGVIIKKQHMLCLIPFPMLRVNVLWTPIQRLATVTNTLNIGMLILITRQPVEMSDSLGSDYWTREQMETPHSFTLLLFSPNRKLDLQKIAT